MSTSDSAAAEGPTSAPSPSFNRDMVFEYGIASPIAAGVRRIVAPNPSALTFKGTNTYLIGTTELAVVDPGPDIDEHLDAVIAAANDRPITHIFLTHTHRDHSDAVAPLQERTGAKTCAIAPVANGRGAQGLSGSASDSFVDRSFRPDIAMADGEAVAGPGWQLTAVHTPGHAPDHLCFAIDFTGSGKPGMTVGDRGIMLSGDHVMGWNTSVVAPPEGNMSQYMASLELLIARNDQLLLPGHGEVIAEPSKVCRAYLMHRRWRERIILDCIRSGVGTIEAIVEKVYAGIDPAVKVAAALSVLAHIERLIERDSVAVEGKFGLHGRYSATRATGS